MRFQRLLRNRAIGLTRRTLAPLRAWRDSHQPDSLPLETVSRRLELLLAAMFGRRVSVGAASAARARAPHAGVARAAPDVVLPAVLDARAGRARAFAHYRLLAIEQAARLVRGSSEPMPQDALERDLYMLVEAATIDRGIVRQAPGLADDLRALRSAEVAKRVTLRHTPPAERDVETLVRSLLAGDPAVDSPAVPEMPTPADSAAWARSEAARIRARNELAGAYRGVPAVELWTIAPMASDVDLAFPVASLPVGLKPTNAKQASADATEQDADGDERTGAAGDQGDEQTPEPGGAADQPDPAAPQAALASHAGLDERPIPAGGIPYREWDEYADQYRPDAVTVHAHAAPESSDGWAAATLRAQAPLVRQVRARFAPLRAQRTRLRAQRAGDELDLDACVDALVDMRRGHLPSDRLYRHTRPARRTLAIMLLVDVSGSTSAAMADGRTVLDVERMTLLLATEALDELGDPYAVLAFSGSGAHHVQVANVKGFADHDSAAVRRRISALASASNTRLGAALRHATAVLNVQPAERRLLLLLSDGQPNDVGGYQGSYAVGDSRRALIEARASGVHPFCLTVDREEQEYLPHLFGTNGYRLLREPAQLPAALLAVVTHLLPAS